MLENHHDPLQSQVSHVNRVDDEVGRCATDLHQTFGPRLGRERTRFGPWDPNVDPNHTSFRHPPGAEILRAPHAGALLGACGRRPRPLLIPRPGTMARDWRGVTAGADPPRNIKKFDDRGFRWHLPRKTMDVRDLAEHHTQKEWAQAPGRRLRKRPTSKRLSSRSAKLVPSRRISPTRASNQKVGASSCSLITQASLIAEMQLQN